MIKVDNAKTWIKELASTNLEAARRATAIKMAQDAQDSNSFRDWVEQFLLGIQPVGVYTAADIAEEWLIWDDLDAYHEDAEQASEEVTTILDQFRSGFEDCVKGQQPPT